MKQEPLTWRREPRLLPTLIVGAVLILLDVLLILYGLAVL